MPVTKGIQNWAAPVRAPSPQSQKPLGGVSGGGERLTENKQWNSIREQYSSAAINEMSGDTAGEEKNGKAEN